MGPVCRSCGLLTGECVKVFSPFGKRPEHLSAIILDLIAPLLSGDWWLQGPGFMSIYIWRSAVWQRWFSQRSFVCTNAATKPRKLALTPLISLLLTVIQTWFCPCRWPHSIFVSASSWGKWNEEVFMLVAACEWLFCLKLLFLFLRHAGCLDWYFLFLPFFLAWHLFLRI